MTFGTMTPPLATGEHVLDLIPQRPPFVLVDTLLEATTTRFRSAFTVPADHVLVEHGELSASGLIENAAQTAAMGLGYVAKERDTPAPIGFIGAVSKLQVEARPLVGDRLETLVELTHEVMMARVLEAVVSRGTEVLARLELKVFLVEEVPASV